GEGIAVGYGTHAEGITRQSGTGTVFGGGQGGIRGTLKNVLKPGTLSATSLAPLGLMGAGLGLQGAWSLGQSHNPIAKGFAPALGAVSGLLGFGALSGRSAALVAAGP